MVGRILRMTAGLAVMLALLFAGGVWAAALWHRFAA